MLCRHAWRVSGRDLARGHCAADHCDGRGSDLRALTLQCEPYGTLDGGALRLRLSPLFRFEVPRSNRSPI